MAPARVQLPAPRASSPRSWPDCCSAALMPSYPARGAADHTGRDREADPQIGGEAEPLIEEYNGVHEQYKKNKAKQAELQKKIEPLERQLDLAQLRVGAIAAQVYKGGQADAFNAVLTSGSPEMLADRLSYLDQMAREQERQLAGVSNLKTQYDLQKAPDRPARRRRWPGRTPTCAKKKKDIEAQIDPAAEAAPAGVRHAPAPTGRSGPGRARRRTNRPTGYKVASFACRQAGKPYVWARRRARVRTTARG